MSDDCEHPPRIVGGGFTEKPYDKLKRLEKLVQSDNSITCVSAFDCEEYSDDVAYESNWATRADRVEDHSLSQPRIET